MFNPLDKLYTAELGRAGKKANYQNKLVSTKVAENVASNEAPPQSSSKFIKDLMREFCKGGGGLWPEGLIRYQIDAEINKDPELFHMIEEAIEEWNSHNKGFCEFVQAGDFNYPVTFLKSNDTVPQAHVGFQGIPGQFIKLPYPEYPLWVP